MRRVLLIKLCIVAVVAFSASLYVATTILPLFLDETAVARPLSKGIGYLRPDGFEACEWRGRADCAVGTDDQPGPEEHHITWLGVLVPFLLTGWGMPMGLIKRLLVGATGLHALEQFHAGEQAKIQLLREADSVVGLRAAQLKYSCSLVSQLIRFMWDRATAAILASPYVSKAEETD